MNIKHVLVTLLTLTAAYNTSVAAQTVETISTATGKTYQHCRIFKVDPDGVMFFHQHGGAKILFTDMSADSRNQFGYDPEKAASYETKIVEKQSRERETLAAYKNDLANARAMYPMMDEAQMAPPYEAGYDPGYSPMGEGNLLSPWLNNGWGMPFYNPWYAIRRHAGERGNEGGKHPYSMNSHYGVRGYSGIYSNNYRSTGGAYGPYLNRAHCIPLGVVPPLRNLAPAIGSHPVKMAGGISSGHR